MVSIQIVSDLHLEYWVEKKVFNFIKPTAPILALLGDTCCCVDEAEFNTFKRFILEMLPKYEMIILIPGNHEYYTTRTRDINITHTMAYVDAKIKAFFKETSSKLIFLNNNHVKCTIGKTTYVIIGSTLWSWIPPEVRAAIGNMMNDYNCIYVNDEKIRKLTPDDVAAIHRKQAIYIKSQITAAKKAGYKVIVLTHHKPYLSPSYTINSVYPAYESDLSAFFDGVAFWGYGHTHIADDSKHGQTRLYSNPKGYPNQKTLFNKAAKVTV